MTWLPGLSPAHAQTAALASLGQLGLMQPQPQPGQHKNNNSNNSHSANPIASGEWCGAVG